MSMWDREEKKDKEKGVITAVDYKPDAMLAAIHGDKPIEPGPRIVVVEHLHHIEPNNSEPVTANHRFLRWLDTDEQPYVRKQKVTQSQVPLDHGWLTECSLLSIHNPIPIYEKNPEVEVKESDQKKIIEVSIDLGGGASATLCHIPPGESMRLPQTDPTRILLQLLHGDEVKVEVHLFPV